MYRRFQVTFRTPSSVSPFIDAIRTVCPCKANPTNNEAHPGTLRPNNFLSKQQTQTLDLDQQPAGAAAFSSPLRQSIFPRNVPSSSPSFVLKASDQPDRFTSSALNLNTTPLPSTPSILHMPNNVVNPPKVPNNSEPHMHIFQDRSQLSVQPTSSLPESSPPSSSANSNGMMPPPPPPNSAKPPDADALINSIKDATGLYDLPRDALERLVGDIVREDRFVSLVSPLLFILRSWLFSLLVARKSFNNVEGEGCTGLMTSIHSLQPATIDRGD